MKRLSFLLLSFLIVISAFAAKIENVGDRLVFAVQMEPMKNVQELHIYLDWKSVITRMNGLVKEKIVITDLNNDKKIIPSLIDTDQNGIPEGIFFETSFTMSESLRAFSLGQDNKALNKVSISTVLPQYDNLIITYLTNAKSYIASHNEPKAWSEVIAKTILTTYPDPAKLEIFSQGQWSYTNGYFLNALSESYFKTKNPEYLDYIKQWVNLFVKENGKLDSIKYRRKDFELDNILPGRLLLFLYQHTGDKRYAIMAAQLIDQLNNQPKTSEGGFWHKKVYTQQMWLDGIYMGDVYLAQYASVFNQPQYFDEAAKQMELIYKHTLDTKTGLLYHGWDESKNKIWANSQTGASPEFWGRALGWYIMALVDGLDYFPANHPERKALLQIFKDLSASLAKYQDTATGMWYQVVNKGQLPGNWVESSCTAMFAYAFAKGFQKGYLGPEYLAKASGAFKGLIAKEVYFDDQDKIYLTGTVKVGTLNLKVSKGDYDYYINVDRRINDFKGIAALMYLALTLEDLKGVK
jgi:unsaturated rhamnogalacturonyl hydrolase